MSKTDELFEAIKARDAASVARLLHEGGVSLANSFTEDGWSALHLAPDREIAALLIEHGAGVNAKNRQKVIGPQNRPLHAAAYLGRHDVAEILLEHGAEPSAQDVAGFTPLHLAAAHGHADLVRLLLAHGADANARTTADTPSAPAGVTPLGLSMDLDRLGDDGRPIGADRLRRVVELLQAAGART
jgi:ankyrin repeat protein